ncbi:hypothetical protein [Phytohabitans kaempferiae]|uniref:Uncharacterized protein n=1 Tax=Phytohabitans kaempferiae TaxID=1620943 RepID=A0ABV6LVV6_9ACTN
MLEMVRMLLDTMLNLGPRAMAARKSKKKARLGAAIFRIVVLGQDIVERGDRIIHLLSLAKEVSALRPSAPPPYHGFPYLGDGIFTQAHWYREVAREVNGQIYDLSEFVNMLGMYAECVSLLDQESVSTIRAGMWRKQLAMGSYGGIFGPYERLGMKTDNLGMPVEGQALRIPEVSAATVSEMEPLSPRSYTTVDWSFWTVEFPLRPADLERIHERVDSGVLQAQLADIRSGLTQLRAALDEHFTISEILLELAPSMSGYKDIVARFRR